MSAPPEEYYSAERWSNWLDRVREEELDPDDEDAARLLLNLQDDVAIAVAKILTRYHDEEIDAEATVEEVADIREVVLGDPGLEDEEKAMLVDGVQTSLVCVFATAEQYVAEGVAEEGDVGAYVHGAAEAEAEEDFDRALGLVAAAGTRVVGHELSGEGEALDMGLADELEYGLVTEWVNGLDSLQSALSDPEVIEDDEEN